MSRKIKKLGMVLIVVCCFIICCQIPICAATVSKTILKTRYGTVGESESQTFRIVVPQDSCVKIVFEGYDYEGDVYEECGIEGTYGEYDLSVLNSENESLYQNSGSISFEDKTLSVNLAAGKYTIVISNTCEYMGFDYIFSVIAQYKDKSLNKSTSNMVVGEQLHLILSDENDQNIGPEDINLSWTTSDSKIATISSSGIVKAIKPGSAMISAVYAGKKYSCKITVKTPYLNKKSVTLNIGGKYTLRVGNSKGNIKWSSSNNKIVSVNSKGEICGKGTGTANIYAIIGANKLQCKVQIRKPTISSKKMILGFGEKDYLEVYNCSAKITWSSSNRSVVKVGTSGNLIAGKKPGKATITAKFMGKTLKCLVTVKDTTYDTVKRTYRKKLLKADTVWYVDRRDANNNFGDRISHPFQVMKTSKIIFSFFPESTFKCAIFNSKNQKVWERIVKKETHYEITLKKGNYKLLICKKNKGYNGYSFRTVNSAASFLPFELGQFYVDSAGGVEPEFLILNKWSKTIKYIDFELYFYNRVGDLEYNQITGYPYSKMRIIGPIKKWGCGWYSWNPVIFNYSVYSIKISKATITFMDGSTKTFNVNKRYYEKAR